MLRSVRDGAVVFKLDAVKQHMLAFSPSFYRSGL
jgi:hypothetical protein